MKKLVCLLLVVVMLCAVLVSCKKDKNPSGDPQNTDPSGNTTTVEGTDPNRVPPAVKDFGGYEFKFVMDQQTDYQFQVPEEIGSDGINKALVERNKKVEGMYNVKILEDRNPNGNSDGYAFLDSASSSGDYFGDIYSNYAIKMIQQHAIAGFYLDLGQLTSLRLDQAWWDQDFVSEFKINGHLYTITGDIQTNDDLQQILICMNLDLYNKTYGATKNFYDILVKDKAWTFEEFYNTWYNFGSRDTGKIGVVDGDDIVGYYYDCRTLSYMYMASGMKAFKMENNKPVLSISSDKALRVVDNIKKITESGTALKAVRLDDENVNPGTYEAGNQRFAAGKALFVSNNFGDVMQHLLDMEDTVVYPPLPKYDLAQDRYYSLVHFCFEPIAISANVEDAERTALITEALCFYSDALETEVMRVLLKERLTSELETREILQLTLNSKVYDFEYTANIMGWTGLVNDTLMCDDQLDAYASEMASMSKKAVKGTGGGTLEKFLASYAKLNFRK